MFFFKYFNGRRQMHIGQRTPLGAVQTNLRFLAGQVRGAKKTTLLAKSKEDNL